MKGGRSFTSIHYNIPAMDSDTQIMAANTRRRGGVIFNDSTATLYLKLGTGSSPTSFTVQLPKDAYYEIPIHWVGPIFGTWSVANGTARATEFV